MTAWQPMSEVLAPAVAARRDMLSDGAIALAIISILGLIVARSMSVPLARVGEAMIRVSEGDYEHEIRDRKRRDEIGSIARRLDLFRASLVEAEGHARENAFKGAAFEASSSAMMLLDEHLTIIHVNARLEALIRAHAIAIQRLMPDFRPDGLPGRSAERLFPGAERARAALRTQPRATEELRLGQAYIRLDMGRVRDEADRTIGYVVEWTDVTLPAISTRWCSRPSTGICRSPASRRTGG